MEWKANKAIDFKQHPKNEETEKKINKCEME